MTLNYLKAIAALAVLGGCGGSGSGQILAINSIDLTDVYEGNSRSVVRYSCHSTGCYVDGRNVTNDELLNLIANLGLQNIPELSPHFYSTRNGITLQRIQVRNPVPVQGFTIQQQDSIGSDLTYAAFSSGYGSAYGNGRSISGRNASAAGMRTGTRPPSGSWRGAYTGYHPTSGHLTGDVIVRVSSLNTVSVDFSNICDQDRYCAGGFGNVEFPSVRILPNGDFNQTRELDEIHGSFYGPEHQETAGVYVWETDADQLIPGAFGATRR